MPKKAPSAPPDLEPGSRGYAFWNEVAGTYAFRADERELLAEACQMLSLADELRDAVRQEGLTSAGSKGQARVNPLLAELRSLRSELRLCFRQLGLPDAEGETDASKSARAAATARWQRRSA